MELKTADLALHYEDDGDKEAPCILFLHGITQSVATWSWIVPELAGDYRVVRLDFRGHGRSGRTPGAYNFPGYVADATAICTEVLQRPAVVVGHSLGGGTAAGLAQTRPDLVRGVVLEDPAIVEAMNPTAPSDDVASFEANPVVGAFSVMRNSIPRLQEAGMSVADLAKLLRNAPSPSGAVFGDVAYDDAIEAMAAAMLELDVTVLDAVFDGSSAPVFDPRQELPVPGIVVAGDPASPDTVMRDPALSLMTEHSLSVEQRIVAGAGHLIHDSREHRSAVLAAVRDVLARVAD